ncbi:tRNA (5-methylaminomethyl-2-thiouridine)(34)-methyltransferase MnmD [Marixanthomonas spongiae]|uniref:SAM-dependent methyltransferase n=1 Tax=Marixanthomonas spongiae TaxID=2174845 RepID=A0A2U0I0B7_9FLAO|nr:tRNA (5-methylaminomethyl-2-thiouridine)(34)-methyltransferase MnmD [Marixanthomonas spongiae]PVW14546.1 SAM-dependent methyltransferase [Marixanthomonas spongiae]
MKRKFLKTGDGSMTIHLPDWDEQYHSKHGAIAEAQHVFIKNGLLHCCNTHEASTFSIMEIGFGTGLNAFLTLLKAKEKKLQINYTGIEAYPIPAEELPGLNYPEQLNANKDTFKNLHTSNWGLPVQISPNFQLTKRKQFFSEIEAIEAFHLIYFDAFGARVQPELWTFEIFKKMYRALKTNGVLVTYSAKGSVRRNMKAVGFTVERLPGPPGKRQMLRATKIHQ